MEYLVGYIAGVITIGVIRLLELRFDVSTDTVSHLRFTKREKAEIILPDTTPEDIADQIVKSEGAVMDNNSLT